MKNIQLYDYQREMIERIETAFKSYRSVMVQMPTGTGKTILLAEVVKSEKLKASEEKSEKLKVKNPCVWIVVHRRELVEQIKETLAKQLDSSLFPLHFSLPTDSSLFTFPSSLNPSDSSLFPFPSSLKPSDSSLFTFHFSLTPRVFSIQWLSRHYHELDERPSLIIIDEAHHAVAKTYKEVMDAYPEAKKLGLTATPCRLNKHGFTDLFDVLLQSWSYNKFIADGWLSLYDYMSVKADSLDQQIVFGLTKRGADGDFSLREMSEKLDVRPSIERLCDTAIRYAKDKKGIVYAIDIKHAEHIAEYYRERGLNAVAISSKTPAEERKYIIERFRNSNDSLKNTNCQVLDSPIRILVNVDLFGEGFDCPDVEFIQLARPTLSLSKYLQQVGRGMRVYEGKRYCLILDNVGLYRLFGMPSDDRDWQAMFEGKSAGKGNIASAEERYSVAYALRDESRCIISNEQTELITVMTHEGQRKDLDEAYGYEVKKNEMGLLGVIDKDGNEVLPYIYNKVELKTHGLAKLYSKKKFDRERPWMDLKNGVRFVRRPWIVRYGFLDFSTTDGRMLYPRVKTRRMDENCFVMLDALTNGIEKGLQFRTFYIQPSEPERLYIYKEKIDDMQLWEDDSGGWAYRKDNECLLHPVSREVWLTRKDAWTEEMRRFEHDVNENTWLFEPRIEMKYTYAYSERLLADFEEIDLRIEHRADGTEQAYCRKYEYTKWKPVGVFAKVFPQAYDIRVVLNLNGKYIVRTKWFEPFENPEQEYDFAELLDNVILHIVQNGKEYWVYLENKVCFAKKPELVTIGFLNFLKMDDVYVEMSPYNNRKYRRKEIRMGKDICFLGSNDVLLKPSSREWRNHFYIHRRYADGKHYLLSKTMDEEGYAPLYELYYDGVNAPKLKKQQK
ncbi:DEAD/DEAH box helicase [uncultured Prevotella sp.]|uniref:DEAD/DEAH box helicase n=1 Tax=uncultured Prevotella sp. TaxID=159272 RepID=UPI0027E29721|nr:DEAD/DEAH box helicase [uncultured Prevotella sp.]